LIQWTICIDAVKVLAQKIHNILFFNFSKLCIKWVHQYYVFEKKKELSQKYLATSLLPPLIFSFLQVLESERFNNEMHAYYNKLLANPFSS